MFLSHNCLHFFSTGQSLSLPLASCCSHSMLHKLDEMAVKAELEGFLVYKEGHSETR